MTHTMASSLRLAFYLLSIITHPDRCVRHQVVRIPGAGGAHLAGPVRGPGAAVLRAMPVRRVSLSVAAGAAARPRHLHLRPDGQPGMMMMHSLVKSIRFIISEQALRLQKPNPCPK